MIQKTGEALVSQAVNLKAQDIYIIPYEKQYKVFMRVGDERRFIDNYDMKQMASLISHFKFVAGMNVGEKRRCQLGACDYKGTLSESIPLRLSCVGNFRGFESLVIRLLTTVNKPLNYWFDTDQKVEKVISGRGLYLFSGPVGSGKTSLMYQLLTRIAKDKQVITIEDPVEIQEDSLLQIQVNESIGMTYDKLIKLSLRHRPDYLIIGEIRDAETAKAAIRASLTGAVVFSTVHAKSIPGVYKRLLELGIKSEEINHTLKFIAYQRLIAGGGLIDFAIETFETHSNQEWNQKLDHLLAEGHITQQQALSEKISD
ncbi:competence type IV pilus ATPase ComGA [Streptococcus porcinus]